MPKKHIEFNLEMLQSMRPTGRSIKFIRKFFQLTKLGRARVSFTKDQLKKWLFPYISVNSQLVLEILKKYDSAVKLDN